VRENKKNTKYFNMAIAVLIAILLWFYVVNVENPTGQTVLSDIPVQVQGVGALEQKGLMVTEQSRVETQLTVNGRRRAFLKLYRGDLSIAVNVDVSGIEEPGEYTLTGRVSPESLRTDSTLTFTEKNNFSVLVTVRKQASKTVPVVGEWKGTMADGYEAGAILVSPARIEVSGSEDVVARVAKAVVTLRGDGVKSGISKTGLPFVLTDAAGDPVESPTLRSETDAIAASMPVLKVLSLPLTVTLQAGGGAEQSDAVCTIDPARITVAGDPARFVGVTELSLGTINLTDVFTTKTQKFTINLPPGLVSRSGETTAAVNVSLESLPMKAVTATDIALTNIPEGYEATLVTHSLQVWIRGKASALAASADTQRVYAVVDLTGVQPATGQQRVLASIQLEDAPGVGVVGSEYNVAVKITTDN
jgi:YbbR domain-containing protein